MDDQNLQRRSWGWLIIPLILVCSLCILLGIWSRPYSCYHEHAAYVDTNRRRRDDSFLQQPFPPYEPANRRTKRSASRWSQYCLIVQRGIAGGHWAGGYSNGALSGHRNKLMGLFLYLPKQRLGSAKGLEGRLFVPVERQSLQIETFCSNGCRAIIEVSRANERHFPVFGALEPLPVGTRCFRLTATMKAHADCRPTLFHLAFIAPH